MGTGTQPTKVTPLEFAKRHPGVNPDLLLGFVHHNEKDLYARGAIDWRSSESSVLLINERRFFDYILYFPIQAP